MTTLSTSTPGLPVPPPPTPAEQEATARRWREQQEREEAARIAAAAQRTADAKANAESALARLMEASRMEAEARANGNAPRKAEGIPGVEYEFVDLTEQRRKTLGKLWSQDLEQVRNREEEGESLTRFRINNIEDANHRLLVSGWVQHVGPSSARKNLIVAGSVGAGKTAVCLAAGHATVDRGIGARYCSHTGFLEALRKDGIPPGGLTKAEYKAAMYDAPVLVLDDFCADMNVDVAATEFARKETISLLNYRMNKGLHNIVSTNVTSEQITTIMDDRVASRLGTKALVIKMVGKDRRKPETW